MILLQFVCGSCLPLPLRLPACLPAPSDLALTATPSTVPLATAIDRRAVHPQGLLPVQKLADAKPGEVAFVSAAAGATGSAAAQALLAKGCRVIGSAGSAAKVASPPPLASSPDWPHYCLKICAEASKKRHSIAWRRTTCRGIIDGLVCVRRFSFSFSLSLSPKFYCTPRRVWSQVAHLLEIGLNGAFNYKTERPADALGRLCPEGIDIYFDNVGGETLDAALVHMRRFGRVILCGAISTYDRPNAPGVTQLMQAGGSVGGSVGWVRLSPHVEQAHVIVHGGVACQQTQCGGWIAGSAPASVSCLVGGIVHRSLPHTVSIHDARHNDGETSQVFHRLSHRLSHRP